MTENQVTVAMEKYANQVSRDNVLLLREKMQLADENCMDGLMLLPVKNKWITLALSFFFGGIGAGRFYLGDFKLGIAHVVVSVITVVLSFIPLLNILRIILNVANSIWVIAELFVCFYKAKYDNYVTLTNYLVAHKREEKADAKKSEE